MPFSLSLAERAESSVLSKLGTTHSTPGIAKIKLVTEDHSNPETLHGNSKRVFQTEPENNFARLITEPFRPAGVVFSLFLAQEALITMNSLNILKYSKMRRAVLQEDLSLGYNLFRRERKGYL